MKWLQHPISGQHFYLKAAVFLTGLAIGLDSSLRQLVIQLLLILAVLVLEPQLYLALLAAIKKLLPFLLLLGFCYSFCPGISNNRCFSM